MHYICMVCESCGCYHSSILHDNVFNDTCHHSVHTYHECSLPHNYGQGYCVLLFDQEVYKFDIVVIRMNLKVCLALIN